MTTEYSIQKMVSDGTLSTIALGIQYLQRNDIYIRIAGEETPQSGAPSGYTWSFINNTTLKILPVVPNGVEVVVYRRTDVDAMYNIYSQNAQFDEATIDENNQQLLYIAQEYLEQGIPGAGVGTIEFLRDDGTYSYYRVKRTDGSYSDEFSVPSASNASRILIREALRKLYAWAGYTLVPGSFQVGFTLVSNKDVALDEVTGKAFSGLVGTYPAGTSTGGFTDRSNEVIDPQAVQVSRPSDTAGSTFPQRLSFYFKSAPINLTEALPSNYVPDGSVDYSTYVQKVCEYLREYGGGRIIVPHNMKILIGNINSYANIEWFGNDWTSELIVKPNYYGISVNEGTGGTTDPADNARNCVFNGFRIRGQVETAGFSQQIHLLNLNAVSALTIQNMSVAGAQGDHVYIGSSNVGGVERHNEDVTIDRLFVDGINKNQRNGVSVIDCDGLKITRSRFKRVTRSDMPGAIDIEPNNYAFSVIKNITIEDVLIDDCGGAAAVGAYVPPLPAAVEGNATNIRFNRIDVKNAPNGAAASIVVRRDVLRQSPGHGCSMVQITGKDIKHPFSIEGVVDGAIYDCSFENATEDALIGNTYKPVRDLKIEKLSLNKCGTVSLGALKISNALGLDLKDSKFVDCGNPTSGGDIRFGAGTSERIKLMNNAHDNPSGGNSRVSSADAAHVFIPTTNQCIGNTYQGTKILSIFPAFRTDETNGVQNVYTASTPPNGFPQGTSTALWNSPAGTLPVGYTQGVCVTENPLSTIGINQVIVQRFTPRGNGTQLDTFYRYASADGLSWGAWRKITSV